MRINFKKLHENAKLPKYAKQGDAGLDLFPVHIEYIDGSIHCYFGIAVEIPEGYCGLIFPRSSIYKHNMILSNCVGLIDSGYRGEIKVVFKRLQGVNTFYNTDAAVCQMVIMPYPKVEPEWADVLSDSDRGFGGFGHTGI